jgi:uncharacterized protein
VSPPPATTDRPISQYVLKVHSRCDLACDHCYVYEHADQSWRGRPRSIAPDTVRAVADRIAEHAAGHGLASVTVVLHGGEPLLLGAAGLDAVATTLRDRIAPVTRLDLRMQTNGVLLTEPICDVLADHDIRVGVSLDGDRSANDRHRRFATGASSHHQVLAALALLRRPAYRRQYAGLLCTIDIANDPHQVYDALAAELPPRIDLLLPHATWDTPPPRPDTQPTPYADWLLAIYDRWTTHGRPMRIRLFDALRSTAAGGPSGSEWVGLDPADLVVIETDGAWEQVDSLKTTYDGAPATGLTVHTHSVDDVAALPAIARRQTGLDDLAPTCQTCPVVRQCGGGLYAHRYHHTTGFTNPSVYCADLMELIVSINARSAAAAQPDPHPTAAAAGVRADVAGLGADEGGLPAGLTERIGSGRADAAAIGYLVEAQLGIGRALAVTVGERGSPGARVALDALRRFDREAPDAVRAVLGHPYLRVWATQALKGVEVGRPDATDHLGGVAAAVAVRAGRPVTVTVPVEGGSVHLPTIGTLTLPDPASRTAEVTVEPPSMIVQCGTKRLTVEPDAPAQPLWQPARWITVDGLTILLEDLDPNRDCHEWKAAGRLPDDRAEAWRRSFAQAWHTVTDEAPAQVPTLRVGLRTVTPLEPDPGGLKRASTARDAFGAFGCAPAAADALAVMLVHEFQHTVLGALLDICHLYDRDDRQHLTVAWRSDPRPIEGVLQGTFAHLAVADIWRVRAERAGPGTAETAHYRQYRDWTAAAIDALTRSDALTPAGNRFVEGMATTMATWS